MGKVKYLTDKNAGQPRFFIEFNTNPPIFTL